jgi:hypothetical protein
VKTLCGSLVAGACGYYGAFHFFTSLLVGSKSFYYGLLVFFPNATIESLFVFPILLYIFSRAAFFFYHHSGERDQRLAKLPEVSTSDGSIRDGVLRAE